MGLHAVLLVQALNQQMSTNGLETKNSSLLSTYCSTHIVDKVAINEKFNEIYARSMES
jgi:hypothetical protein